MNIGMLSAVLREALPDAEFVADSLDPEKLEAWRSLSNDVVSKAEQTMNHRHMMDALSSLDWEEEFAGEDLLLFADVYASVLRDQLRRSFPDTAFVVEIFGRDTVDEDPSDLIVTYRRAKA